MECHEHLNSLTSDTELLVYTAKKFEKLAIYFCLMWYLCPKMCSVGSGIFLKSTCCTLQNVIKIIADIASILNNECFGHCWYTKRGYWAA